MMEVQDYKPPRKRHVHPENLSPDQRVRERGFQAGVEARRAGESRDSSHWHRIERERRTTLEDCGLAAFELGWDTAAQGAKP